MPRDNAKPVVCVLSTCTCGVNGPGHLTYVKSQHFYVKAKRYSSVRNLSFFSHALLFRYVYVWIRSMLMWNRHDLAALCSARDLEPFKEHFDF